MTIETVSEAEKMRRVPGIYFMDGATGRRACVAGTGIDVWEIISAYAAADRDWDTLREGFDWLSEVQLRAALAYYDSFPEEIDQRLEREAYWTEERVWQHYPFMRPR